MSPHSQTSTLTTSSSICLDPITIALALLIVLNISWFTSLTQLASWPCILKRQVRITNALVPLAPGTYPINIGVVDSTCVVRIALSTPQSVQLAHLASWPGILTQRVRIIDALVPFASGAFLGAVDVAWYDCLTIQLIWLLSRSTW